MMLKWPQWTLERKQRRKCQSKTLFLNTGWYSPASFSLLSLTHSHRQQSSLPLYKQKELLKGGRNIRRPWDQLFQLLVAVWPWWVTLQEIERMWSMWRLLRMALEQNEDCHSASFQVPSASFSQKHRCHMQWRLRDRGAQRERLW